jgi:hypothetical protein
MVLRDEEDTTTKGRSSLCNLFELDDKTIYKDLGLIFPICDGFLERKGFICVKHLKIHMDHVI